MSPINFERLQTELPEYSATWAALRDWFAANWRKRYVELSRLHRALGPVNGTDLVLAIQHMVDRDMLRPAYRVKAPGGYLLEDDFPEPSAIPERLWDRDGSRQIRTSEGDIVSGFRWEAAGVA